MMSNETTVIGVRLLQISVVYLVVGLVLGLAMGISNNFALSSVHAHVLLLGWTTMAVAGIVYLVMPDCAQNRMATLHFWGHNLGLPLMMASLGLQTFGHKNAEPAIAASSILVLVSLLLFAINVFLNGKLERP
mgnify:CR=1 FL=1